MPRADEPAYSPPPAVRRAAQLALAVRAAKPASQRGMTRVGLATARLLASGQPIRLSKIRHIARYFPRHEVDKAGQTWASRGRGWQAWHGWGGDAGWAWARRILRQHEP